MTTRPRGGRRWLSAFSLTLGLAAWATCGLLSPAAGPAEREAKPKLNLEDKDGIWVLDFKFKDPRLITVDIPGRGRRLVWYLWYQVSNHSKEPRTFYPRFELVTLDKNTVHYDQVLPAAQEAIKRIEDPTGYLDMKNSVTITEEPIAPSKPADEAVPITVTGVATWDDVEPDANRYSIFVTGLSNGWTEVDAKTPDGKPVIRRKTLQLNFTRLGDRFYQKSEEIRFVPPSEWLYRSSALSLGAPGKAADAPKAVAPKDADAPEKPAK